VLLKMCDIKQSLTQTERHERAAIRQLLKG